jgi:hypothetical protein
LIRDLELVKDIQNFRDRIFSIEDIFDPILGKNLSMLKGQTPVFTSHNMKMMMYLVDICSKELADCLEEATADGKLSPDQHSYIMH